MSFMTSNFQRVVFARLSDIIPMTYNPRFVFIFRALCFLSAVSLVFSSTVNVASVSKQQSTEQKPATWRGSRIPRRLGSVSSAKSSSAVTAIHPLPKPTWGTVINELYWYPFLRYNDTKKNTSITVYIGDPPDSLWMNTEIQIVDDSHLYLHDAVLRTDGKVDCSWSKVPPFSVNIVVKDNTNRSSISRPKAGTDYTRLYQRLLNAQYVADSLLSRELEPVRERFLYVDYYLVKKLHQAPDQIEFWSNSTSNAHDRNTTIQLVLKRNPSGQTYLERVSLQKDGTTKLTWSIHPLPVKTIAVQNDAGILVAEIPFFDGSTKFFEKVIAAQKVPDTALLSTLTQETTKIDGVTYYCFFTLSSHVKGTEGLNYPASHKLWSKWPIGSEYGLKSYTITREWDHKFQYLHEIWLSHDDKPVRKFRGEQDNGPVGLLWKFSPPLSLSIYVERNDDYFGAELKQSEAWANFYKKVLLGQFTYDKSLPYMVTIVTKEIGGKTYYLSNAVDDFPTLFQVWSLSLTKSLETRGGYLVTKTVGNKTEYLKEGTDLRDMRRKNTWVKNPPLTTTFRKVSKVRGVDEIGVVVPTHSEVLAYIDFDNAVTTPPPVSRSDTTVKKKGDQNVASVPKPSDSLTTKRSSASTTHSSVVPIVSAESTTLPIPSLRLWVAPERYTDPTVDERKYAAMDKFRSVLSLTIPQRDAVVLQLLPELNGLSSSDLTAAVENVIVMDLASRKEWCGKTQSSGGASAESCVGTCQQIVEDATVLFVKNVQPEYPTCKFGHSRRVTFMWSCLFVSLLSSFLSSNDRC